jgi:hypothetical protein
MREAIHSTRMSVLTRVIQYHIPENGFLDFYHVSFRMMCSPLPILLPAICKILVSKKRRMLLVQVEYPENSVFWELEVLELG